MSIDHIPPHSIEAELAVLGAMLIDRSTADVVTRILRPSDFYAHIHEPIYAAITALVDADKPIDKISLGQELQIREKLDSVGGMSYLSALMSAVGTAASAEYYATIVREKSDLRGLISAGVQISKLGYESEDDVAAAIRRAESILHGVIDRNASIGAGIDVAAAVRASWTDLENRYHQRCDVGQRTPWASLDDLTGRFFPGETVLWPAIGGTGKTGLLLMLADYIAANEGHVLFFSIEMTHEAIMRRYIALHSEVSAKSQRLGRIADDEWPRLMDAVSTIAARRMTLFGSNEVRSIADMRRELRRMRSSGKKVSAAIVDHVGLCDEAITSPTRGVSTNDKLERAYRDLVRLSQEFGIVTHSAQHVNRGDGKMGPPTLVNIRNGGNPEGHMDTIISPYRPNQNGDVNERMDGQFLILKSRDGEAGTLPMKYHGWRGMWVEPGERAWFENGRAR